MSPRETPASIVTMQGSLFHLEVDLEGCYLLPQDKEMFSIKELSISLGLGRIIRDDGRCGSHGLQMGRKKHLNIMNIIDNK
jgi:hypothetical protein